MASWSLGLGSGPALGLLVYTGSPTGLWLLCLVLGLLSSVLVGMAGAGKRHSGD